MILELNQEELGLLMSLVDSRISELHPEIRRTMDYKYRDELKENLHTYQAMLERLKAAKAPAPTPACEVEF